jgi:hypothetical protein
MTVPRLNSALKNLSEFDNFARLLRAIGQDLTELYPEDLENQVNATEFPVSGVGLTHHLRSEWNMVALPKGAGIV